MSTKIAFRDRVAQEFRARPHEWVNAYQLMQIGGALAFRTRVSECRTQLGMVIGNDVRRDKNGVATSWYRFVPKSDPMQADLLRSA